MGIRRSTIQDRRELREVLTRELLPSDPSTTALQEFSLTWFKTRSMEPPAAEQLERLIRTTSRDFESCLLHQMAAGLTAETKAHIDRLLNIPDDSNDTAVTDEDESSHSLRWLKGHSGHVSLKSILYQSA